jgi:hypothetical protein
MFLWMTNILTGKILLRLIGLSFTLESGPGPKWTRSAKPARQQSVHSMYLPGSIQSINPH